MRQRNPRPVRGISFLFTLLVSVLSGVACEKPAESPPPAPNPSPASQPTTSPIRVASLVPSATDLLLGSGLGSHLVAVSNYCRVNPAAADIPSAGDYQSTDWERLASVKPNLLLVFMSPDRIPPGMKQRAAELNITIEVVNVETVADVLSSITRLGDLVGEPDKARSARSALQLQLDTVRIHAATRPKVRTLITLGDSSRGVIGPGGFLDELLTLAGGTNVAAPLGSKYPNLDDEQLAALRPDHIIHLLPGATPDQVESARALWSRRTWSGPTPHTPKLTILTGWWLLQPGYRIGDTAAAFDLALSSPTTLPPTLPAGGTK